MWSWKLVGYETRQEVYEKRRKQQLSQLFLKETVSFKSIRKTDTAKLCEIIRMRYRRLKQQNLNGARTLDKNWKLFVQFRKGMFTNNFILGLSGRRFSTLRNSTFKTLTAAVIRP